MYCICVCTLSRFCVLRLSILVGLCLVCVLYFCVRCLFMCGMFGVLVFFVVDLSLLVCHYIYIYIHIV